MIDQLKIYLRFLLQDRKRGIPLIVTLIIFIVLLMIFDIEKVPNSGLCIVYRSSNIKRGKMVVVNQDGVQNASRIVAIAGDTLEIIDGATYINGHFADENRRIVAYFNILPDTPRRYLREMERAVNQLVTITDTSKYVNLPIVQREENWKNFTWCPLLKNYPDKRVYPHNIATHWNAMHMGKIIIPKRGMKIKIDAWNLLIYSELIEKESQEKVKEGDEYTFKKDYCFYLNDNRNFCNDSRIFGPIATENVVGKIVVRL